MDEPPVLELRGITKEFPGVLANDHVDFDLRRGEVHALLGENGAGKSTLMSILYGLYSADEGEILMNGEPVDISSPKAAIERGIGMVHQHFMLIPVMTVTANIVLANEPVHAGGDLGHLHHAQTQRGARDRRPHHGAPAGQTCRDDPARWCDGSRSRALDGRARGPPPRGEEGSDARRA